MSLKAPRFVWFTNWNYCAYIFCPRLGMIFKSLHRIHSHTFAKHGNQQPTNMFYILALYNSIKITLYFVYDQTKTG
jgi:hypothetical protein